MCELLGINCNKETNPKFSFTKLKTNTSQRNGWGVSFNNEEENNGYFITIKSSKDANSSELAKEAISLKSLKGTNFIAHVRTSSGSTHCTLNTHPFELSLNPDRRGKRDKSWVFAHNGSVNADELQKQLKELKPHGDTDSEIIFCWIIEKLRKKYPYNGDNSLVKELAEIIKDPLFQKIHTGINFLMSDGNLLFAYYGGYSSCGGLHYMLRSGDRGKVSVGKTEEGVGAEIALRKGLNEKAAIVSTYRKPLTEYDTLGQWVSFRENQLIVFKNGDIFPKGDYCFNDEVYEAASNTSDKEPSPEFYKTFKVQMGIKELTNNKHMVISADFMYMIHRQNIGVYGKNKETGKLIPIWGAWIPGPKDVHMYSMDDERLRDYTMNASRSFYTNEVRKDKCVLMSEKLRKMLAVNPGEDIEIYLDDIEDYCED
jgi:predicted glutamine amidotransferase